MREFGNNLTSSSDYKDREKDARAIVEERVLAKWDGTYNLCFTNKIKIQLLFLIICWVDPLNPDSCIASRIIHFSQKGWTHIHIFFKQFIHPLYFIN